MGVTALPRRGRTARLFMTFAAAAALFTVSGVAEAATPQVPASSPAAARGSASLLEKYIPGAVLTEPTANYHCLVLYPGGAATWPYSLGYRSLAPARVGANQALWTAVDFPEITPNPSINEQVRQVRFVLTAGPGTHILAARALSGIVPGTVTPTVTIRGDSVIVQATGPFVAGQPFKLAPVAVNLRAPSSGTAQLTNVGERLSDPAFSWVLTHANTHYQGPFSCFLLQPATLVSVPVH